MKDDTDVPQKDWIENILESLAMVEWDRFVRAEDDGLGVYFDIYGWIDREEDAYKDFILLRVFPETDENLRMFTTSSDRYHDEINEILFGETAKSNHCQRVEHTFKVSNVVELEECEAATDGGEEVEAAVERERKTLDELSQEEKDTLVSELMREPQTSVAVVSAVRKIDDIEAGPGELPESFDIGCQKCNEPIEEGDEYTTAFGYYYCKPCHERAQEALKTAEDVDGGEA